MTHYRVIALQRDRFNAVTVHTGRNLSGVALKAQIRTKPDVDSPLVAEWGISIVDSSQGIVHMTIDGATLGDHRTLYTDMVDISGRTTVMPVLQVKVVGSVTE